MQVAMTSSLFETEKFCSQPFRPWRCYVPNDHPSCSGKASLSATYAKKQTQHSFVMGGKAGLYHISTVPTHYCLKVVSADQCSVFF